MRHTFLFRVVAHRIHLVLHQRDQRTNHDRHSVHQQRRQLVAQALSSSRRHQHKRVISGHHIAYDGFLMTLERVEPEIVLQRLY